MANLDPNTGQVVETGGIAPPAPTVITTPPPPTPQTVYSAPNITQAVTSPQPAPNLADPYGLYNQFTQTPEILAAQAQVAQGQQAINAAQEALRTTTRALEGQNTQAMGGTGASVNLIGRQVGRARQLTADELAGLGETQQAALANLSTLQQIGRDKYQIAQQERAQLQSLIAQTNGEAGIAYTDSYEVALSKATKWEKDEEEKNAKENEEKEEEAYKNDLKAQLRALGISNKNDKGGTMSVENMEKALTEYYGSERAWKEKDRNKASSSGSKDSLIQEGTSGLNSFFDGVKGQDGYVSPGDWAEAKSQWAQNGLSTSTFNAIFGKWKNPNDKYQ